MFGWFSRKHADLQGHVIVYGDKRVTAVYRQETQHESYLWDDKICVGEINGPISWEDLNGNKIPSPHLNKFPVKTEYTSLKPAGRNV